MSRPATNAPPAHFTLVKRRTFIGWISLLVWEITVCVLWARSYRFMDEWSMATQRGEVRALLIHCGAFHFVRGGSRAATRPVSYDRHDVPADGSWNDLYAGERAIWSGLGFAKLQLGQSASAMASGAIIVRRGPYRVAPWILGVGQEAWVVPFWPLLAAPVIPVLLRTRSALVRHRRLKRGACPRCGYDLRATPGRCPECGYGSGGRD